MTTKQDAPTQRAARILRSQFQKDLILLYKPELIVDTSTSNNPELQTEYTLSADETETVIEQLMDKCADTMHELACELVQRKRDSARNPDE